jgi:hypothetical protein
MYINKLSKKGEAKQRQEVNGIQVDLRSLECYSLVGCSTRLKTRIFAESNWGWVGSTARTHISVHMSFSHFLIFLDLMNTTETLLFSGERIPIPFRQCPRHFGAGPPDRLGRRHLREGGRAQGNRHHNCKPGQLKVLETVIVWQSCLPIALKALFNLTHTHDFIENASYDTFDDLWPMNVNDGMNGNMNDNMNGMIWHE